MSIVIGLFLALYWVVFGFALYALHSDWDRNTVRSRMRMAFGLPLIVFLVSVELTVSAIKWLATKADELLWKVDDRVFGWTGFKGDDA